MLDKDGKLPKNQRCSSFRCCWYYCRCYVWYFYCCHLLRALLVLQEGGRTGLTSLVSAILFALSLFLSPIFLAIPSFATAPALIVVGFLMLTSVTKIDFDDLTEAIPAFIAIIAMPFLYSISEGIALGVISYVIINVCTGKAKDKKISPLMYALAVIFVLKYVFL